MPKISENPENIRHIYFNEFNHRVDKMVKRSLSLPVSYTLNAPDCYLGEATVAYIHGLYNASIALSRATLEQLLKNKLEIPKNTYTDLDDLIIEAAAKGFLDQNYKSAATKIRKWGNIYLHDLSKKDTNKINQEKRAKEVLLAVKKIIELLYKKQSAGLQSSY